MSTWTLVFALIATQVNYNNEKDFQRIFNQPPNVQIITGFSSYENCMQAAESLKGNKELYSKLQSSSLWSFYKEPYGVTESVVYAGMKCLEIK